MHRSTNYQNSEIAARSLRLIKERLLSSAGRAVCLLRQDSGGVGACVARAEDTEPRCLPCIPNSELTIALQSKSGKRTSEEARDSAPQN